MKKLLTLLFALLASPVGAQVIPSGPFGSINYWGPSGSSVNLVPGLAGFCLTSGGTGQPVAWQLCPGATLASLPSINTNQFYGNVSGNFQAPIGVDVNTILNTVGYDIARPPAVESILYKSNVGPTFNWQTLPPGVQGSLLTSGGATNPPFWAPTSTQADLSSICTTVGAVLYFDTPSLLWKCLAPGTSGQLLQTGGAAGNPSWLTVTLATLGGVPSTRNVNTSSPLGGGGPLSADLTLTCSTCLVNGGALGTPLSGTLTNTTGLPISTGVSGLGTSVATTLGNNLNASGGLISPTPTRAGDVVYWNGSAWTTLAGNNSGTQILQETSAGVPSWAAAGSGTVTSAVIAGTAGDITATGTCTITTTGTCTLDLAAGRKTISSGCAINATATATCADGSAGANNGTYTTPTGALWLEVELQGGGGGGCGSGTGPGAGGAGTASTFGTSLLATGTNSACSANAGGTGGTPTGGFMNKVGGNGGNGSGVNATPGGAGCSSPYGGGGSPGAAGAGAGGNATTNSGSGGGGGGVNTTVNGGGGGPCGGFLRAILQTPNATYTYVVGAGGAAGTAGTGGAAGGAGGAGYIQVIPHFN